MAADLLRGEVLKTIPKELLIGTRQFQGQRLHLTASRLDLAALTPPAERGGAARGRTVYLLAPVTATSNTTIQIGAGADWWMQWWLDGQPVYSTLGAYGNGPRQITGRDHIFDVTLTKGEHVLAVAVIGGLRGFSLAVTSPQELRVVAVAATGNGMSPWIHDEYPERHPNPLVHCKA